MGRYIVSSIATLLAVVAVMPSSASAQSFECRQVLVAMRDGVRLATDVHLPRNQGPGPYPVVIERTPYDKGDCRNSSAQYFARRGYVAIVQDERGRFESEGEDYWLRDEGWGERRDGYDTIEWAAAQPWSTGKVGTMGLSFTCLNQYLDGAHLAAAPRGDVLRALRRQCLS